MATNWKLSRFTYFNTITISLDFDIFGLPKGVAASCIKYLNYIGYYTYLGVFTTELLCTLFD